MGVNSYDDLMRHVGHKIVCVTYGNAPHKIDDSEPICENVAIECEDCNEVLVDFDRVVDDD